jgi:hypothetical protein
VTSEVGLPDYGAAAWRHHDDAQHLLEARRLASADHLAGFATECFLKYIQVSHLHFKAKIGAQPQRPPEKPLSGHLPSLWDEMALLLAGRSTSRLAAVLSSENPFGDWRVDDRYSDGSRANTNDVRRYIKATAAIAEIVQRADVDGELQ